MLASAVSLSYLLLLSSSSCTGVGRGCCYLSHSCSCHCCVCGEPGGAAALGEVSDPPSYAECRGPAAHTLALSLRKTKAKRNIQGACNLQVNGRLRAVKLERRCRGLLVVCFPTAASLYCEIRIKILSKLLSQISRFFFFSSARKLWHYMGNREARLRCFCCNFRPQK